MRGVWPWLLLTACYSGGAIEIRVAPPDGVAVQDVELFVVGVDDEARMETVRPEANPAPVSTIWWTRDPHIDLDVQPMAPDGVTYEFKLGGVDDDLESVIAVGYNASGDPVAMASLLEQINIPHDSAVDRYVLKLDKADPLPRSTAPMLPPAPGLQLWGPVGGDQHQCVQVDNLPQLADLYPDVKSAMIVKQADDPDCDNYTDTDPAECLPREFMGQKPMTRDSFSCVLPSRVPVDTQMVDACVAGGATCTDSQGLAAKCSPSSYCAPTAACSSCGFGEPCTLDTRLSALPHIECQLGTTDGAPGSQAFCGSSSAAYLHLAGLSPDLSGLACDHAELRKAQGPGFDTRLDYTFANGSASARIDLHAIDESTCEWNFYASGTVPYISGATSVIGEYPAIFAVALTSPVTGRGLVLPIVFRVGQVSCTTAETICTFVPQSFSDTGLHACVSSPVLPGTEVLD